MNLTKDKIYYWLVRKNENVRYEYERYVMEHTVEHYEHRFLHWKILLKLKWHYQVKKSKKSLLYFDMPKQNEKHTPSSSQPSVKRNNTAIYTDKPESNMMNRQLPQHLAANLMKFDVISFDIFDTMIFRPFQEPADIFMLVGERLNIVNFTYIRKNAEKKARERKFASYGTREITVYDIYEEIFYRTGLDINKGVETEFEIELELCIENPYIKRIFDILKCQKKQIVVCSDMYYPRVMLEKMLTKCGYTGISDWFISCEFKVSKANSLLYDELLSRFSGQQLVHIGDNFQTDITNARKKGLTAIYYRNVNTAGNPNRVKGMSPLVGSAYAGIINAHLHNGLGKYSYHYEYGFVYAGLYILGFCNFIYEYAKKNNLDKILFLARDGDICQQVFSMLHTDIKSEYIYWSRIPAIKVEIENNRDRFLLQIIEHKLNYVHRSKIGAILESANLECMEKYLPDYSLRSKDYLNSGNIGTLEELLIQHWNEVIDAYSDEKIAYKDYLSRVTAGCKKVAVVDVGWMGNVVLTVKNVIEKETAGRCKADCILAGITSADIKGTAGIVQNSSIVTYIFDSQYNRDIYNFHKNKKLSSFFFEMMTQSTSPTFKGIEKGNFYFDVPEVENYEIHKEVHRGIVDFSKIYTKTFKKFPYMYKISGFDAYQPFASYIMNLNLFKKTFGNLRFTRSVLVTFNSTILEKVDEILKQNGL